MISCLEAWGSRPSAPLVKTRLASPSSVWLLANCRLHCMKTPSVTVTYPSEISSLLSTSDFTIFKKPSFCVFFFFKYKNLLSETMGHQLCFGRKSVCAEISVQKSGRDGPGPAWEPANLIHFGPIRATFAYRWLTY